MSAPLIPKPPPRSALSLLNAHISRDENNARTTLQRQRFKRTVALQAAVLILVCYLWFRIDFNLFSPADPAPFRWSDAVPSTDLHWTPCFDGLECARLKVPLDWTNPADTRTVAIALTKVPASVPETDPSWSGPVLVNPGGPGGPGTDLAISIGRELQAVVGRTHSVVGFDPRGVKNTTPATSCFPSEAARVIWFLRAAGRVMGHAGNHGGIAVEYARAKSLGRVCAQVATDVEYAGTPNVARDMLAIVEASWNAVGVDGTKKGLRYWGFSYGTVLGQTFASMFPERVERVVVDGVVDIDDYYAGGWSKNLQDADKVLSRFYSYCASSPSCAFTAATPSLVEKRLRDLMARAAQEPIPVYDNNAPDWVTDSDIRTIMFWALYFPIARFPIAAEALAALETGNGAKAVALVHYSYECQCSVDDEAPNTGVEADFSILCQDGGGNNSTMEEFTGYVDELKGQSEMIGGNWAQIQMSCTGWVIPAKGLQPTSGGYAQLGGSWGAERTRHPLLFVSSEFDPVTPLDNARAMRKRFGGAGLLVQGSEGHCSLSAPSACAVGAIGRYFRDGTVEETVECVADATPWGADDGRVRSKGVGGVEEGIAARVVEKWRPLGMVPGGFR